MDDKVIILKSIYIMLVGSKGNVNRYFDNINYNEYKYVEYDEDNDDERSLVIFIVNGDIV